MNRSSTKPNVLFVVLDQLRADVLNGELAHRVTHADGQFARTMTTAEGAVRGAC